MFIRMFWIRIGQEVLMEDNLADDEIELELSPIAVQLAYVQQVNFLSEYISPSNKYYVFKSPKY